MASYRQKRDGFYLLFRKMDTSVNRLYFPEIDSKIGGPSTFMRLFENALESKKISFTCNKKSNFNKVFFPIQYDIRWLKFWKSHGVKIYQRLDGLYYSSHFSQELVALNKPIETIYKSLSDVIIYQSEYSKAQCFEIFGSSKAEEHIIYNGVNQTIFYPNKNHLKKDSITKMVMTGNFRNIDMVEPLLKAVEIIAKQGYEFELNIVGPVDQSFTAFFDKAYIKMRGSCSSEEIAGILRSCDLFIYSFLNPNCPNSVIEAIATGLPVVGFDSGSMKELCCFQTELLANVSDRVIQLYEELDAEKLAEKISLCIKNYEHYKNVAIENSHRYDIRHTVDSYLKVLQ